MRFLSPSLFYVWAPLVLVPIVLYLFRPRPRTVRTSTLPFFKWLAREHQDSTWLKWLKHLLSLLLSILVILGAAAALGRLVVSPPAEALRTVVLLVDRSASMSATAPQGSSLLDSAVRLARQRLAGLPEGTGVIVMAYDRRPEVLLARSLDRRQVQRALGSIEVRPLEGDPETALALARRLAALETPAAIWHVTDASVREKGDESNLPRSGPEGASHKLDSSPFSRTDAEPDVTVEHLRVALEQPVNVGITAFQLRRLPLQQARLEAFVQVHSTAPETVEAELEMRLDGKLVRVRKLSLEPGGREKLLIPVDADPETEQVLSLRISAPGDRMAVDDAVWARIPRLRPLRVLWIAETPDPFTELALSSLGSEGDLEVLQGGPSAWPATSGAEKGDKSNLPRSGPEGASHKLDLSPFSAPDVVIFDSWLPKEWPAEQPAIVVNPPGSLGPFRAVRLEGAGLPLDALRATETGHPLLYGVATGRVALTQTAVVEAAGPLEPIWVGSHGPLLLAGEARGERVVVMAFSPPRSERLPLTASYPLLIGNAVYWAAADRVEPSGAINRRTGELVELEGETITWRRPDDDDQQVSAPLTSRSVELGRIGLWETDGGQRGSASLLSTAETLLPSGDATGDAGSDAGATAAASLLSGDLTPVLLWGMLFILILESWLFHRYLAY